MAALTRRQFLIASGWIAGGATIVYKLRAHALASAPTIIFPEEYSGAAWLQICSDGSCRMFFSRQEMGQNANTGLSQIAAEELNLEPASIKGIRPNTSDVPPLAVTAASMSLTAFSRPTAIAAATLREALRDRAALKLGAPLSEVLDDKAGFKTPTGEKVSYSDLISENNFTIEFDDRKPTPALYTFDAKRPKQQIGRSVKPSDLRDLVTGRPAFTGDVPIRNVLFGRAIQPPVRNASLASLMAPEIERMPGFVKLVHENDFVGVVCTTPGAAAAALAKIETTWHLEQPISQSHIDALIDVDAKMADGDLEHVLQENNHRNEVDWAIDLRFDVQVQTHAQQEPRVAIARFNDTNDAPQLEIWTGSQDPWAIKRSAAWDTGLAQENIVIYPQRMGGAFGGREYYEVERDAVRLARAVGRPVKVQWDRRDEFVASRSRPASAHRLRIALDERSDLSDWWYGYISGHVAFARERLANWLLPVVRLSEDLGVVKGAIAPYTAVHQRVEYSDVDLPIDLGVWRSLNAAPSIFAIESAMDELAVQKGLDPVDFKIAQMKGAHPRLQRCLEKVRELSDQHPLSAEAGYGRGFACGSYDERCFIAVCADIYIDQQTQKIKVQQMYCAQDVGMVVNPDQLRAQVESNMAWSIGMALLENLELADDHVKSSNFDNYRIPRMTDMPVLHIEIIDRPSLPPTGAGEVALIAGPPAIANAIRNASGFRPLRLPITFSDVAGATSS